MSKLSPVLWCISRLPCSRIDSLIWLSLSIVYLFNVPFLFLCSSSLIVLFSFYLFIINPISSVFANHVTYAWFIVQAPDKIIVYCMFGAECKSVQNTSTLTFVVEMADEEADISEFHPSIRNRRLYIVMQYFFIILIYVCLYFHCISTLTI